MATIEDYKIEDIPDIRSQIKFLKNCLTEMPLNARLSRMSAESKIKFLEDVLFQLENMKLLKGNLSMKVITLDQIKRCKQNKNCYLFPSQNQICIFEIAFGHAWEVTFGSAIKSLEDFNIDWEWLAENFLHPVNLTKFKNHMKDFSIYPSSRVRETIQNYIVPNPDIAYVYQQERSDIINFIIESERITSKNMEIHNRLLSCVMFVELFLEQN